MSKKPTAGGEVDAYCTKCKMDLNHRIVAMEGDTIRRVECLTCRGQHNYRRPKSAEPATTKKRTTKKRTTKVAVARALKAQAEAEAALLAEWEQATEGRAPKELTPYKLSIQLSPGQLLNHKKFGPGVVYEVTDEGKAQVLFELGLKLLVFGR
ncbi:MAG: hypothetical protein JRI68_08415 [Deltaproteobacteria bacterium]|nr:hypothetical protein [Deltaproteobacteria bacterium]